MKLSEMMTAADWQAVLQAADGNIERAKVFASIGWHETHWGRLGWGRYGYILGVGAYGSGQNQYASLEAQLEWTGERLGTQESYSLDDLRWYGRNVQKPTQPDGTNTGDAWGKSVHSIYSSLIVDLPTETDTPAETSPDIAGAYEKSPQWAQYAIMALLLFVGTLMLPKGGKPGGQAQA